MSEVLVSALEMRLQKQVESARIAYEKGRYEHAVETAALVLREQPACLPVRKLLRAAQLKLAPEKPGMFGRMMAGVSSAPFVLGAGLQLKDKPLNTVAAADKLLLSDVNNVAALSLLGQGASALGWLETAIFAHEAARACAPDRPDLNLALGLALLAGGRPVEAVQAAQEVLRVQPHHAEGQTLLRNAAIAQTMAKGNWEADGTYRGKLHDEAKAAQLEQAARLKPLQPPV